MRVGPVPRRTDLILASASPRRRQLLDLIGLRFRVAPATVDETAQPGETALEFAERAARDKAREIASAFPGAPVLAADTVVEIKGRVLGKPESEAEAAEMLAALSGSSHSVHTGMALASGDRCESLVDTAVVRFAPLTEREISWYVATGEPLDKAGAYAIQGCGGLFIESVEGSPHTVVGLPLHRLGELFADLDLDLWSFLAATGTGYA